VFGLQSSKYWTEQHNTRQNSTGQIVITLNNFFVLYDFWGTKCYFGILDNLYVGQKVVLWFGEGQKYQFLSCLLPPVCLVPETVLQIKHLTTGIVLSYPSFFSKSNAPFDLFS